MKYFIGVVPPKNIYDTILNIQSQFGDNRLEPHITLRPPVIVKDVDQWIKEIKTLCATVQSFNIKLPVTDRFGKRVLFISVESPELTQLYKKLGPAIKPFEQPGQEDNRPYHPHLTLGRSWCGFTKEDFDGMQQLADEFVLQKDLSFVVNSIRVYHKPGHTKRYETLIDVPLI
jgi:2'-5' RNA ligase